MKAVFGITGWKNSGKTTLTALLVERLTARGVVVSTMKHAHENFAIDMPGTDSHAHRSAGAQEVAIISQNRWALMHEARSANSVPSISTMLNKMAPCDLVLIEGFKSSDIPKIECVGAGQGAAGGDTPELIWKTNPSVVALAVHTPQEDCLLPQFDINDIDSMADYIAQTTGVGL